MEVLEVENFLHAAQARKLEVLARGVSVAWHHNLNFTYKDKSVSENHMKNDGSIFRHNYGVFIHELIRKTQVVSDFYSGFANIPKLIEQKFNLKINKILSMRMNLVTPLGYKTDKYTCPHPDYVENTDSPEKKIRIFIYYITQADGETVIFNEVCNGPENFDKKTIYKKINPEKNKAIVFDANQYHAFYMPSEQIRIIINMVFETIE